MNDAHLHMVVNHFPIIGSILGTAVLLTGIILKNKTVKNTAFVLLIVSALFGFASMFTGEGAEHMVEDMPRVGHKIIHEHEEIAEKFALLIYATGIFALIGFFFNLKNHAKANLIAIITLVLGIATAVLSKSVGTSGGEIRHTEIRENNNPTSIATENLENEHKD